MARKINIFPTDEPAVKIIEIIHGYPPQYNAGSENYTEAVAKELVRRGNYVAIFCRTEEKLVPEFEIKEERLNERLIKYTINVAATKDKFVVPEVDRAFAKVIENFKPDVAHIEHLNHLSLNIVDVLAERGIPAVYTLHDFWLMCPRGQFIQSNTVGEPWKVCDGQEDSKCASICYRTHYSGYTDPKQNLEYWKGWVGNRMRSAASAVGKIDYFIAPSKTVLNTFLEYYPDARKRTLYLDYGFDLEKLKGRRRLPEEKFVFGYIGTHIPAKGIDYLIKAFGELKGDPVLRIWGRPRKEYTQSLIELADEISSQTGKSIEWMGEFDSERIVEQVFNNVDAIVVPSIWLENSPLVIHEAQQVRVPVITADVGGMAEYVEHERNGLLFKFRDISSLTLQMQRFVDNPRLADILGRRGYRYSENGDVPSIERHVDTLIRLFNSLLEMRG